MPGFADIHFTDSTLVTIEEVIHEDYARLRLQDGFGVLTVVVALTDQVKDQLRRLVRDWDFAEEAELHDQEQAQGYPFRQTLAGTFLGVPICGGGGIGAQETPAAAHDHRNPKRSVVPAAVLGVNAIASAVEDPA